MKVDFQTYKHAAGYCILGLIVQVLIGVLMLVGAVLTGDSAAFTAALYVLIGSLIWLGLAIAFDQHKRERVEALEAEGLAAGQAGTSVFDSGAAEFKVAARRLAWIHKFFLPTLSLVVGGAYVGLGIWRISLARARMEELPKVAHPGWLLAFGVVIAIGSFLLARWFAGLAKEKPWANLRGGAGAAVGASLFAAAIAVGHGVQMTLGSDAARKYVEIILPVAMTGLGAEILLNFLLNLYRPRKAGEVPRPAFDSRMLSFVAAPDTIARSIGEAINYQLGYDVTGNWFYQLLSRLIVPLVGLGLLIVWGLSCLVVVEPHERGMVLRFGRLVREVGPGIHLKAPWPIDRVETPRYVQFDEKKKKHVSNTTTGLRLIQLGSSPSSRPGPILWTNEHAGEEVLQIVQPVRSLGDESGERGGVSVGLVSLELPMLYAVKDVGLFEQLAPAELVDNVIRSVAQREIVRVVSHVSVDEAISGEGIAVLEGELKKAVEGALANTNPGPDGKMRGSGIEVVSLTITKSHPPKDAALSFEGVVQAEQNRQKLMESAQADRISTLTRVAGSVDRAQEIDSEIAVLQAYKGPEGSNEVVEQRFKVQKLIEESGGEAGAEIAQARADRWIRHMGERGRAARHAGLIATFEAAPDLFRATALFDAMRRSWAESRVYIVDDHVPVLRPVIDLKDSRNTVDVFEGKRE
jgi:regulator of protease activity HflC (stomatin/prohibitin superfamily)